jgi:hypothetical protein
VKGGEVVQLSQSALGETFEQYLDRVHPDIVLSATVPPPFRSDVHMFKPTTGKVEFRRKTQDG